MAITSVSRNKGFGGGVRGCPARRRETIPIVGGRRRLRLKVNERGETE